MCCVDFRGIVHCVQESQSRSTLRSNGSICGSEKLHVCLMLAALAAKLQKNSGSRSSSSYANTNWEDGEIYSMKELHARCLQLKDPELCVRSFWIRADWSCNPYPVSYDSCGRSLNASRCPGNIQLDGHRQDEPNLYMRCRQRKLLQIL
jgi:hypothetical protein